MSLPIIRHATNIASFTEAVQLQTKQAAEIYLATEQASQNLNNLSDQIAKVETVLTEEGNRIERLLASASTNHEQLQSISDRFKNLTEILEALKTC
jgi:hypothetical protein